MLIKLILEGVIRPEDMGSGIQFNSTPKPRLTHPKRPGTDELVDGDDSGACGC